MDPETRDEVTKLIAEQVKAARREDRINDAADALGGKELDHMAILLTEAGYQLGAPHVLLGMEGTVYHKDEFMEASLDPEFQLPPLKVDNQHIALNLGLVVEYTAEIAIVREGVELYTLTGQCKINRPYTAKIPDKESERFGLLDIILAEGYREIMIPDNQKKEDTKGSQEPFRVVYDMHTFLLPRMIIGNKGRVFFKMGSVEYRDMVYQTHGQHHELRITEGTASLKGDILIATSKEFRHVSMGYEREFRGRSSDTYEVDPRDIKRVSEGDPPFKKPLLEISVGTGQPVTQEYQTRSRNMYKAWVTEVAKTVKVNPDDEDVIQNLRLTRENLRLTVDKSESISRLREIALSRL